MEDLKWLFKKYGFLLLILLVAVILSVLSWSRLHGAPEKRAEEVWEPPVIISEEKTGAIPEEPGAISEETGMETSEDSVFWFLPQSADCLLSEAERQQIQDQVLLAAESVGEIYKDVIVPDAPNYSSGVAEFTAEQRKIVVEQLGSTGLVSVGKDTDMKNPDEIERFWDEYQKGQNSMVTVYEIHLDGVIGSITFIHRDNKLQTYYVGVRWKEGGVPEIQGMSASDVEEIKLTEKGYFIYAYEYIIPHASLRQYWRIKPLSESCKELTEKYISGLSYVNYNLLVTNWDAGNVEEILMPCMYEDIYRIYAKENLKTENWKIPAEEYERIMTTYFPVSVEQLRENCGYDEVSDSYKYEMIFASPYPPFGEVIDYTENADGTITLFVDGVWPDYNSDRAFRNKIVVEPFEDGTFRYLSNSIEKLELDIPNVRREDIDE